MRLPDANEPTHDVLAVCTANHCRSPVMQYMLAAALGESCTVRSAGTAAVDGVAMHPLAIEVLAARGIDGSAFRSTQLRIAMIDQADLILTAETTHRSAVVALCPNAVNRTFTLLQFARLLQLDHDDSQRDLRRALARAHRGRIGASGNDDLPDPMGSPLPAFAAMADSVISAAATIAAEAGVSTGGPGGSPRRRTEESCSSRTI